MVNSEFGGNSTAITSGGGSVGGTSPTSGLDGVAGSLVGSSCSSTAAIRGLNLWPFPMVRGQAAGFWRRQGPGASSSHSFAALPGKGSIPENERARNCCSALSLSALSLSLTPGCAEVRSSQGFSSIPRKRVANAHKADFHKEGVGSRNGTHGIG